MRSKLSLAGILLVLLVINVMIAQKERALAQGRAILMRLAPVDPRSLMQGDYMVLRYALADEVPMGVESGLVYVTLDANNVATALSPTPKPEAVPLRYRRHEGRVLFDAESYFFQEGQRDRFSKAEYGELRVDEKGTPILVGLLDGQLRPIKP